MQILDWLASLPAWMPYGVATALTMWLMYISWPRTAASNAMGGVETSDRADPLAAPGNEKRSLSPAQKHKISELLRGQLPKESKLNIACFGREECIDFAQDFSAAINAAGYESKVVYGGFIGGPTDPNARDLEIIFGPLAYKGLVCSLSDLLTAFSVKHQLLEEEENARMPFRIVVNRPS